MTEEDMSRVELAGAPGRVLAVPTAAMEQLMGTSAKLLRTRITAASRRPGRRLRMAHGSRPSLGAFVALLCSALMRSPPDSVCTDKQLGGGDGQGGRKSGCRLIESNQQQRAPGPAQSAPLLSHFLL